MQSPNPYSQYPQANPYGQPSQAYTYSQQPQANLPAQQPQAYPYPQQPPANPYAQQPQASYPYPQQQSQPKDYKTYQGTGKKFIFSTPRDSNGCNFAILWLTIFNLPVIPLERHYLKLEKKSSKSSFTVSGTKTTTTNFFTFHYQTPLVLNEVLLMYALILSGLLVTFIPLALFFSWMFANPMVDISPVVWILMTIWLFVPGVALMTWYDKYTSKMP